MHVAPGLSPFRGVILYSRSMASSAGILFGIDTSYHQTGLNVGQLKPAGVAFVIARTAQAKGGPYGTIKDPMYQTHKANAAAAGQLFSSYFYVGNGLTPQQNVDLHASVEPDRSVPLMLDVETGSGDVAFLRQVHAAFVAAGYHVWGTYLPRWYWQQVGSPDLTGLPPLVSSRYPDNVSGSIAAEYNDTPDSYWLPYGGLGIVMIQFSSAGHVPPYAGNLDLDAFKGTRDQLAQVFSPAPNPPGIPADVAQEGITEMTTLTVPANVGPKADPDPEKRPGVFRVRSLAGTSAARLIVRPGGVDGTGYTSTPVTVSNVFAWASDKQGVGHNPVAIPNYDRTIESDRVMELPGAVWADFFYESSEPFEIDAVG